MDVTKSSFFVFLVDTTLVVIISSIKVLNFS